MCLCAAGLRCEEGVQKSGAADQTRRLSGEVTCCAATALVGFHPLSLPRLVMDVFVSFREHFGHKHPKYSDTLLDYGFYLLNVDNICQSVAIYQVKRGSPGDEGALRRALEALSFPCNCRQR